MGLIGLKEKTMINYFKRVLKAILNKQQNYTNEKQYVVNNNNRFDDKIVIITGGTGAIGSAIAFRFLVEGATVYVGGRNQDKLNKIVQEAKEKRYNAKPLVIDVTDENSIENAVKKVIIEEEHVDVLVNCAGGSTRSKCADLIDQDIELIDEMLTTNLRGSMLCTRAFGKLMAQNGAGKIINIASVIGDHGKPKFSDYAASKAGIIGYTKSVAQELGALGINVNCVSPGFIQRGEFTEEQLSYLLNSNFLHKVGCAEDIASAVAFLASDEANFITGQNLCIDGGRSLGLHGD